jgi:hypothetical protein
MFLGQLSGTRDETTTPAPDNSVNASKNRHRIANSALTTPTPLPIPRKTDGDDNAWDETRLLFGERGNINPAQQDPLDESNDTIDLSVEIDTGLAAKFQFAQFGIRSVGRRQRATKYQSVKLNTLETPDTSETKKKYIISQFSLKKALWDTLMDILVAYSVTTSLYFLAFDDPSTTALVFDHLVRVMFILDIIVIFNTEITGPRGNTILDRREIARNYARGWLAFDVIACIPFREMWRPDVEYLCRMIRVAKLPNAVNLIDGRGFSLIVTMLRQPGSRDENIQVDFVFRYIGSLL